MVQLETAAFVHPQTETAAAVAPPVPPSVVSGAAAVTLHQFPMITFEVQIASRKGERKKKRRAGEDKKQKNTESAHL